MGKSFWQKENKGDYFSNDGNDTFDPNERCIGIRLMQGVPLLDSDWNELEDIRRFQEWVLRKYYIGNGSIDDGFIIGALKESNVDFSISAGRFLINGLEAVNEVVQSTSWDKKNCKDAICKRYSEQRTKFNDGTLTDLTSLANGNRSVYLDIWIGERAEQQKNEDVKKLGIITNRQHIVNWRVRVDPIYETIVKEDNNDHHYHKIGDITVVDKVITKVTPTCNSMKSLEANHNYLKEKLTALESRLNTIEQQRITALESRLNTIEQQRITALESRLNTIEQQRITALESRLNTIEQQKIAALGSRLDTIEQQKVPKDILKALLKLSVLKEPLGKDPAAKEALKEYLQ